MSANLEKIVSDLGFTYNVIDDYDMTMNANQATRFLDKFTHEIDPLRLKTIEKLMLLDLFDKDVQDSPVIFDYEHLFLDNAHIVAGIANTRYDTTIHAIDGKRVDSDSQPKPESEPEPEPETTVTNNINNTETITNSNAVSNETTVQNHKQNTDTNSKTKDRNAYSTENKTLFETLFVHNGYDKTLGIHKSELTTLRSSLYRATGIIVKRQSLYDSLRQHSVPDDEIKNDFQLMFKFVDDHTSFVKSAFREAKQIYNKNRALKTTDIFTAMNIAAYVLEIDTTEIMHICHIIKSQANPRTRNTKNQDLINFFDRIENRKYTKRIVGLPNKKENESRYLHMHRTADIVNLIQKLHDSDMTLYQLFDVVPHEDIAITLQRALDMWNYFTSDSDIPLPNVPLLKPNTITNATKTTNKTTPQKTTVSKPEKPKQPLTQAPTIKTPKTPPTETTPIITNNNFPYAVGDVLKLDEQNELHQVTQIDIKNNCVTIKRLATFPYNTSEVYSVPDLAQFTRLNRETIVYHIIDEDLIEAYVTQDKHHSQCTLLSHSKIRSTTISSNFERRYHGIGEQKKRARETKIGTIQENTQTMILGHDEQFPNLEATKIFIASKKQLNSEKYQVEQTWPVSVD